MSENIINHFNNVLAKKIRKVRIRLMSRKQYVKYLRKCGMKIGYNCDISKTVIITEPWLINIEDNVRLTQNVQLITHEGSLWTLKRLGIVNNDDVLYGKITIGENTNIGWDAKIMPNVTIGKNCIIGAGTIVTHDIPDGSVAVGIPARVIKSIDEYTDKILKCKLVPTMYMTEKQKYEYYQLHCDEFL